MNNKTVVTWTNRIALAFVTVLIYWVFIFAMMMIFDFKIFRQNLSEAFGFSVLGILAILCGSVVINIMLNLTRIADKHNGELPVTTSFPFKGLITFLLSFPLIFVLMYAGDRATKQKKERFMIASAKTLINDNSALIKQLSNYHFDRDYLSQAQEKIELLSKTDTNFPDIQVLVKDTISQKPVILSVSSRDVTSVAAATKISDLNNQQYALKKIDFIFSTSVKEREYLFDVLNEQTDEIRYEAYRSNYRLFYPVQTKAGTIVILLSDYMHYGKIGS